MRSESSGAAVTNIYENCDQEFFLGFRMEEKKECYVSQNHAHNIHIVIFHEKSVMEHSSILTRKYKKKFFHLKKKMETVSEYPALFGQTGREEAS